MNDGPSCTLTDTSVPEVRMTSTQPLGTSVTQPDGGGAEDVFEDRMGLKVPVTPRTLGLVGKPTPENSSTSRGKLICVPSLCWQVTGSPKGLASQNTPLPTHQTPLEKPPDGDPRCHPCEAPSPWSPEPLGNLPPALGLWH